MLKSRTLAYDGRGNYVLRELSQIQDALNALGDGLSTPRNGFRLSKRSLLW
jgi:phosphoribosylaminoimidazole carboxylase (NCAIR synthetase)